MLSNVAKVLKTLAWESESIFAKTKDNLDGENEQVQHKMG